MFGEMSVASVGRSMGRSVETVYFAGIDSIVKIGVNYIHNQGHRMNRR